jgi:endo-cleaving rubber dioxygenase
MEDPMSLHRVPRERRLAFVLTVTIVVAGGLVDSASAQTVLTGGRSATLKDKPGADRDLAKAVFRDAALTPVVDPRCGSGEEATVTLASSSDDHRAITLPCANWTAKGKGYLYRDRTAAHGGVTLVKYDVGKLQVKLEGAAYQAIGGPVDAIELGFAVGDASYCGRFSTFRRNDAASVVAKGPTTACEIGAPPAGDLLGSRRGGSPMWDACYYLPDDAPMPLDPRTLVQPGVNAGKAVHFNAWWKNCHVDPEAVQERGAAATCGELRQRFHAGDKLLDTGGEGVGGLFTATDPGEGFPGTTFNADQYNMIWTIWGGFLTRPDNFDQLVAERYGSGFKEEPNPYPLPGEDPNLTNGGSGRLPEMFTQMRDGDGSWSGEITVTCHACHSGTVGSAMTVGGGSSLADLNLFLRDFLPLGYESSLATAANLNRTRGRNNASLINLAFAMAGIHAPDIMLGIITSGSTADMDTPAWWNMGHRPVKFVDGVFPMDAPRVDMVFYAPSLGTTPESQAWMRDNGPDLNAWVETLKAPAYPYPVDTALAEEGAVLFHTLDMWAPERNNAIRRPEGNGSCASCHGAYAPRYVNDPAFLDDPALEGIASYIVPLDIIGTDPERVLTNNEEVQQAGSSSFFGYPQTAGTDQDCGPQNRAELRGDREIGYLAPPLYGVWASAPYLHNGAVPNVWEVLDPSARHPIWRRVSTPPRADQGHVIMGYDTDLDRAYDHQKLGWRYDPVPCEIGNPLNPMVSPYVSCTPDDEWQDPLAQQILDQLYSNLLLAWNILFPPILTNEQMEDRKNFNTRMYAQDNAGHEFNAVLTDDERRAIVEYLKTL